MGPASMLAVLRAKQRDVITETCRAGGNRLSFPDLLRDIRSKPGTYSEGQRRQLEYYGKLYADTSRAIHAELERKLSSTPAGQRDRLVADMALEVKRCHYAEQMARSAASGQRTLLVSAPEVKQVSAAPPSTQDAERLFLETAGKRGLPVSKGNSPLHPGEAYSNSQQSSAYLAEGSLAAIKVAIATEREAKATASLVATMARPGNAKDIALLESKAKTLDLEAKLGFIDAAAIAVQSEHEAHKVRPQYPGNLEAKEIDYREGLREAAAAKAERELKILNREREIAAGALDAHLVAAGMEARAGTCTMPRAASKAALIRVDEMTDSAPGMLPSDQEAKAAIAATRERTEVQFKAFLAQPGAVQVAKPMRAGVVDLGQDFSKDALLAGLMAARKANQEARAQEAAKPAPVAKTIDLSRFAALRDAATTFEQAQKTAAWSAQRKDMGDHGPGYQQEVKSFGLAIEAMDSATLATSERLIAERQRLAKMQDAHECLDPQRPGGDVTREKVIEHRERLAADIQAAKKDIESLEVLETKQRMDIHSKIVQRQQALQSQLKDNPAQARFIADAIEGVQTVGEKYRATVKGRDQAANEAVKASVTQTQSTSMRLGRSS